MKKGIFIFILLILALFSVSCVCAADVDDALAANEDTGEIELSHGIESADDNLGTIEEQKVTQTDNEEKTGATDDGTFEALRTKIEGASSGDTVYLENNYSCEDSWSRHRGIDIDKSNLVIDGQGHTIDAKQKTRIFDVYADNVTIKNIKFINAKYENSGGAIQLYESANGSVSGCSFVNCSTGDSGGAICWYDSPYGSVSGCSFVNCSAGHDGGAIEWSHSDNGSVSGCSFVNCSAGINGGAVNWYSSANGNISDCVFINNTASEGRAINMYSGSSASLDCNWFGNTAENYKTSPNAYISGAVPDNWLFLNATVNPNPILITETADIIFKLYLYNGTSGNITDYTSLAKVDLTLNSNGKLDKNVTGLDEKVTFTPTSLGTGSVTATIGDVAYTTTLTVTTDGTTFWDLNQTINGNTNDTITLDKNYAYNPASDSAFIEGIAITRQVTINGNGHTIDAKGQARILLVICDNVNINNVTFLNGKFSGHGGAIFFDSTGNVTNCNFTNNTVTGDYSSGGAIFFVNTGTVTNCNFVDNTANYESGAIRFSGSGTVSNCNFTDNSATVNGGAVYFHSTGNVTNCNFINNSAISGGAIYFVENSNGNVKNCNFINNSAISGGAIYFAESFKGYVTNCDFTNNTATKFGGAVFFYRDSTVKNCNFTKNTASTDGGGGAIWVYYGKFNVTNCNFINNTAGTEGGGALNMVSGNVTNCNFINNTADTNGGAFWVHSANVTNCNFINNSAISGGATKFEGRSNVANCNFINNSAISGGAIKFEGRGNVTNCNFTGNKANTGSAIYSSKFGSSYVSNSCFLNNKANVETLDVVKNENNITITFMGQDNLLNAIYSENNVEVTFNNVTYWGANGITTISSAKSGSNREAGQNITIGIVVNDVIVLNEVKVTDENGAIVLDISVGGNYYISARHDEDSYYTQAETILTNMKFHVNVTETETTNKTVNITAKSNIFNETMPGKLLFILPNGTQINATYGANGIWWAVHTFDAYGEYQVNATYVGLDNVTVNNATITVNKIKTELSGNAITTTYNINKDLIITLTDSNGNPLAGEKITVSLNGAKTYTTDKNGQVKVSTKGLAPKTYTAKVTFNGDTNYDKSTKDIKVTVKKATPKLTAKKKTFKSSVKTKKYTVVLKDNTGKAIKKAKVTLKVKGKTYKATTNSKGKAVFKIKNLKKKGKYTAVIKFKGNKYYNKATKKAKIKVIVTFKTVSKGSKDKATVREIQQALKNNGYYLTYDGHYLKIDGIYHGCTERSVKEFQHDKHLKVTGKVDEITAKKLGII
ncbi:right-handed parallel beta-helix repeat-containing protein [Methanobrevibacter thaueri]|uniref:right-handed parallel beta-helix repeat-containing protein n=1 Tax=Methanobrevibacter thaueri TaxID=190975 RepID=UPI000E309323|nr:right-handed parallel beta-helix repeat-containing protein [Methanobrevibacter thaueri]